MADLWLINGDSLHMGCLDLEPRIVYDSRQEPADFNAKFFQQHVAGQTWIQDAIIHPSSHRLSFCYSSCAGASQVGSNFSWQSSSDPQEGQWEVWWKELKG